jgi:hypothetical protein
VVRCGSLSSQHLVPAIESRHESLFEISYQVKDVEFSSYCKTDLLCPHCGSDYLHHYGFTDYDRIEDAEVVNVIDCGAVVFSGDGEMFGVFDRSSCEPQLGGGLSIFSASDDARNPSSRRHGIVVKFWCENCHHLSLLCIAQHKGHSQMFWRAVKAKRKEEVVVKKRKTIKPKLRFTVLKRDNYTCQSCGATPRDGVKLEIDHIKPVSMGGSDDLDNLQVLCRECNLGKGARES